VGQVLIYTNPNPSSLEGWDWYKLKRRAERGGSLQSLERKPQRDHREAIILKQTTNTNGNKLFQSECEREGGRDPTQARLKVGIGLN
jgi:hypothetical protein